MKAIVTLNLPALGGEMRKECSIEDLPQAVKEIAGIMLTGYERVLKVIDRDTITAYPILIRIVPDDYNERKFSDEAAKRAYDAAMNEEGELSISDVMPRSGPIEL